MADFSKQYDVSPQALQSLQERNQRRNALRQEYMKISGDPYRASSGEGGFPFDPAMARLNAARIKTYEYFRPTVRNGLVYYSIVILPISIIAYVLKTSRDKQEKLYRTGQVSYADRQNKFI